MLLNSEGPLMQLRKTHSHLYEIITESASDIFVDKYFLLKFLRGEETLTEPFTHREWKYTDFSDSMKLSEEEIMEFLGHQNRRYRMYGLVPYNLSPIQQGIQFGHAVVEFANEHFNSLEYKTWAQRDKTFIILNGGTTNMSLDKFGSLNEAEFELSTQGIVTANFYEPDLGDQLTAVVFLVDDRVWDRELWPDYDGDYTIDGKPEKWQYDKWLRNIGEDHEKVLWLRNFLRNFKLA